MSVHPLGWSGRESVRPVILPLAHSSLPYRPEPNRRWGEGKGWGVEGKEGHEPRQEKDERNRRKPHERWEAYGSFLIIGWAGGGCNRSLTCFRRVIVTHFLSPSFPHVLHSSLHCVSRLVTLRSEDGNVSDGRWAWVTRERHGERDVGSGRDGRLIRALGRQ